MTDYPQHIVAAMSKLRADNPDKSPEELLCLALTMTPPEPPKDVLVEAFKETMDGKYFETNEDAVAFLRAELAKHGWQVAPIPAPIPDEVIEREASLASFNVLYRSVNKSTQTANQAAAAVLREAVEAQLAEVRAERDDLRHWKECAEEGLAERDATITRLEAALRECGDQFAFYAREHTAAGKHEKAATNQRFADLAHTAIEGVK